jgi:transcriptional regulator with XRE-family HTH domain
MQDGNAKNRLRELRRKRGLVLIEVAAHIDRDQSVISRYEAGTVQIPDDVKLRLAAFYGVTVAYLMGWENDGEAAA